MLQKKRSEHSKDNDKMTVNYWKSQKSRNFFREDLCQSINTAKCFPSELFSEKKILDSFQKFKKKLTVLANTHLGLFRLKDKKRIW
jgi:hypothetical protein